MTEASRIRKSIAKDRRSAYTRAKNNDSAYTVRGNKIVKSMSDGSVETIKLLPQTKVLVAPKMRKILIK